MAAKTTIGQRVKQLRDQLKFNHQQFAAATNTTVSTIYRIESDETVPREKTLKEMCRVFGIEQDWLIHGKGELAINEFNKGQDVNNPYREALFKQMQDRIDFLEGIVKTLAAKK